MPRDKLIQWRRGTAAGWTSVNPILAEGEAGLERDTGLFKLGDGTSTWTALDYANDGSGGGGTGDMAKATYDPGNVAANVYARGNHTGTQSADTITDGTTNKAFLATERTKLSGIATGATANLANASLLARANHTGTQDTSTIANLAEYIRDTMATALVAGSNVTVTVNDAADTITVAAAGGGGGGGLDAEAVRDTIATALIGADPIDITVDDASNTITISSSLKTDFGFCQSEIGNQDWFDETEIRQTLQGMKDAGATWVRFAAWWRGIAQTSSPTAYTWTGTDRCLNLIEEYGMKPLMCIVRGGTPLLFTGTIANFAGMCGAIAARYGAEGTGQLQQYEIWNEQNNRAHYAPFGLDVTLPYSDFGPDHYTDLLIAASAAIRGADSESFILVGGFMSTADFAPNDIAPSTFLQGIYDNGGGGSFDAVGYHWYSHTPDFTTDQEPTRSQYFYVELEAMRAVMVAEGDAAKDVHITEMGFSIDIDADVRASWTAKQIELVNDLPYVRRWYLYNYRPGVEAESDPDSKYGIVDFDFTPKQPIHNYISSINAVVPAAFAEPAGGAMAAATYDPTGVADDAFDRANHTGSQLASTVSNFSEAVDDRVAALLAEGTGIDIAYNDAGNVITITATGGGGGGTPPYVEVLDAVVAGETFDVTHGLNSNNLDVSIKRSWLMDEGISPLTNRGEHLWPFKWWPVDQNTIRVDLSISADADELIATIYDKGAGGDTTNPSVGTLTSPTQGTTTIDLLLSGSTDAVGVVGYEWERDVSSVWTPIATTGTNTFQDTSLPPGTSQDYRARVFDLQGRFSSYANMSPVSTGASAAVVLDTAGAGNRVTGTTTISASQVATAGSGKHLVAYVLMNYGTWFGGTDSDWNPMTLTSNQGVASAPGTPVALTRRESQIINSGNPTAVIHLYELDNPAVATHTLTLGSVPGGIGSSNQITIFSATYHNVAALDNIVSGAINTNVILNQNVVAGTDDMAIMGAHFHPGGGAITGFSKTQRDADGGSNGYGVFGDAPGEADNSVNFQTTTTEWHAYIGARLQKL